MDASLVQRVMFRTTGADIHTVSGLVQEYLSVNRLVARQDNAGLAWRQLEDQLEHCLRLYLAGTPLPLAKRLSGYSP